MEIFTRLYEKLIDFGKQKLSVVLWFFICSAILLFTPNAYLRIIHIDNSANIITGLIFLISGVLLSINIVSSVREYLRSRREKQRGLMLKKSLLKQLDELYNIKELKSGFKSQRDCITWETELLLFLNLTTYII